MAFFKELGKHLSGAAQTVGKRTTEVAEINRLNGKIQHINEQVDSLYSQIGKAYFATRNAAHAHEAADRLCLKIDELNAQLQALGKQVDKIKHQNRCPNCGGVQPSASRFCASCGTRLPDEGSAVTRAADDDEADAVPYDDCDDCDEDDEALGANEADIDLKGAKSREHVSVEINWPKSRPFEPHSSQTAEPVADGEDDLGDDIDDEDEPV